MLMVLGISVANNERRWSLSNNNGWLAYLGTKCKQYDMSMTIKIKIKKKGINFNKKFDLAKNCR